MVVQYNIFCSIVFEDRCKMCFSSIIIASLDYMALYVSASGITSIAIVFPWTCALNNNDMSCEVDVSWLWMFIDVDCWWIFFIDLPHLGVDFRKVKIFIDSRIRFSGYNHIKYNYQYLKEDGYIFISSWVNEWSVAQEEFYITRVLFCFISFRAEPFLSRIW